MKVLFVIPDLEPGSAAAQLAQLVRALPADRFHCRVFALGHAEWAPRLREAGAEVDAPGSGRFLDLRSLARLREVVRSFAPAVLHAWRPAGLRAAALSGFRGRLVASPLPRPGEERSWLRWLDARLLRKADRVVAFGAVDAARCANRGVDGGRLVRVEPGIGEVSLPPPAAIPGVPAGGRVVLCAGRLEMHKGFQEAIWALDILRYAHADLHLVVAGAGPDRPRLERFTDSLRVAGGVHFAGPVGDVFPLMSRAEVVWAPGRTETGTQVVLEAMASGRPVVAADRPRLAELVREGETGFLVPPGDKTALARQTQRLLTDAPLHRQMGEAARRRAREHFAAKDLAERCARVYLD
jgi:glycosyltransferase involved in cell wall biosynthesis